MGKWSSVDLLLVVVYWGPRSVVLGQSECRQHCSTARRSTQEGRDLPADDNRTNSWFHTQSGEWCNNGPFSIKTTKYYQWSVFPLTNRSHHSSQVGLPLLLVLILRVPDQIGVDSLTLVEALQPVQLHNGKQRSANQQFPTSLRNQQQQSFYVTLSECQRRIMK